MIAADVNSTTFLKEAMKAFPGLLHAVVCKNEIRLKSLIAQSNFQTSQSNTVSALTVDMRLEGKGIR